MKKAIIILPTYNEIDNIEKMINRILSQQQYIKDTALSLLIVDDSSPDGTAQLAKIYAQKHKNIHLLTGKKEGLGKAYIRGFKFAIKNLHADIILEMDADFSHNPRDIPRLIKEIENGADFVIGSRYTKGGSIPKEWSFLRILNSKIGNLVAKYIAGIKNVKDTTGGFRAINTPLLQKINLNKLNVKGYAFQISLLDQAIKQQAKITEIPIHFQQRQSGQSKIRIKDIVEFITNAFIIRLPLLAHSKLIILSFLFGFSLEILLLTQIKINFLNIQTDISILTCTISTILLAEGIFTLFWMTYAWEDPERIEKTKSPKQFAQPEISFTALIPARHEQLVIKDTIKAVANIDYPESKKEILIICRTDDEETIIKAQEAIQQQNKKNIKLITFNDYPINKPHSLNLGLKNAKKDIIVVFDAEDEPHKDIYHIANTIMTGNKIDVLQSGVQLMNYNSKWFSLINVLEYFFWFKSGLHLFSKIGSAPLGGNTVFFKRKLLKKVNGWNEKMLTEDADIGIRLSLAGAKISVVYDEKHVTKEETPHTLEGFIKQRTRWHQGFMQVLMQGKWKKFPKRSQQLLALYILAGPQLQALLLLYLPLSLILGLFVKLPVILVMFASLPLYLLIFQIIIYSIGLYEFTKEYQSKFSLLLPLKLLLTFYPYQILLGASSIRATIKYLKKHNNWEKTLHLNVHRNRLVIPADAGIQEI